jgi:hypothetical protein
MKERRKKDEMFGCNSWPLFSIVSHFTVEGHYNHTLTTIPHVTFGLLNIIQCCVTLLSRFFCFCYRSDSHATKCSKLATTPVSITTVATSSILHLPMKESVALLTKRSATSYSETRKHTLI